MRAVAMVGVALGLAACTAGGGGREPATPAATSDLPTESAPLAAPSHTVATAGPVDGNRWVEGKVDITEAPTVLDAGGELRSVVGAPLADDRTLWVVTRVTGEVVAFAVGPDGATAVAGFEDVRVSPDTPPLLVVDDLGRWTVLAVPEEASTTSTPLPLPEGRAAYVTRRGGLRVGVIDDGVLQPARDGADEADLLRDTQLTTDGASVHALARPTDVYGHGVLGDAIEAAALLRAEVEGSRATVTDTTPVPDLATGVVVEGTAVTVADVVGDGEGDRLVTVSGPEVGAQVVAVTSSGVVASQPIGQGNRWRHVIGVLPGPDGPEVVEVVTPHLGRRLQFLTADDDRLEVLAAADDVSASHVIGSRDLGEATLADVVGAGPAFLGPGVDRTSLIVARREGGEVRIVRDVPLGAAWATNLASVAQGATADLAVGLEDGRVLVWTSRG